MIVIAIFSQVIIMIVNYMDMRTFAHHLIVILSVRGNQMSLNKRRIATFVSIHILMYLILLTDIRRSIMYVSFYMKCGVRVEGILQLQSRYRRNISDIRFYFVL